MNIDKIKNQIFLEAKIYVSKNSWNNNIFNDLSKKLNINLNRINAIFPEGHNTLINMYLNLLIKVSLFNLLQCPIAKLIKSISF